MDKIIRISTESFEEYEYSRTKIEAENFFWNVFADYYLEIIKDRLYNKGRGVNAKRSAQYTLYYTLLIVLKLFAPIMPYITEEIYQLYFKKNEKEKSIHNSSWPSYGRIRLDKKLEKGGDLMISIIADVRKFKSEHRKSLKEPVILTLNVRDKPILKPFLNDLEATTMAKKILFSNKQKISF